MTAYGHAQGVQVLLDAATAAEYPPELVQRVLASGKARMSEGDES